MDQGSGLEISDFGMFGSKRLQEAFPPLFLQGSQVVGSSCRDGAL